MPEYRSREHRDVLIHHPGQASKTLTQPCLCFRIEFIPATVCEMPEQLCRFAGQFPFHRATFSKYQRNSLLSRDFLRYFGIVERSLRSQMMDVSLFDRRVRGIRSSRQSVYLLDGNFRLGETPLDPKTAKATSVFRPTQFAVLQDPAFDQLQSFVCLGWEFIDAHFATSIKVRRYFNGSREYTLTATDAQFCDLAAA